MALLPEAVDGPRRVAIVPPWITELTGFRL